MDAKTVYAVLKKRIDTKGMTQEKVDRAIQSYLERNPIVKNEYDAQKRIVR